MNGTQPTVWRRINVRALVEGAIFIALSQILSYIKVYEAPFGGSITAASMLPIVVFALRWGPAWGFGGSFVYGVLQYVLGRPVAINWQSLIGDYLIAFGVLGVASLFRGRKWGIFYAMPAAGAARFLVHFVVGATVWAEYMPPDFNNPWFYSLLYNGAYMLPDTLVAVAAAALVYRPLRKYFMGQDIRKV